MGINGKHCLKHHITRTSPARFFINIEWSAHSLISVAKKEFC
jgi:hypothetical protein